jgi:dephospho-CoA kinase
MKDKPKIEVLVGMIASGKSTYSRSRAQDGAIIINDDGPVLCSAS